MLRRKRRGLVFYEKKKVISRTLVMEIFSWLFYTVVALAIAWLLVLSFGYRIEMTGSSMEPTITSGEDLFIDRVWYRVSSPKRGDIIVFYPNGNENARMMVKRVVALPGETVKIDEGILYIDEIAAADPEHLYDPMSDAGIAENGLTLGNKEYFVLGDKRNASEDSRSANIGAVHADSIIGRVWFTHIRNDE